MINVKYELKCKEDTSEIELHDQRFTSRNWWLRYNQKNLVTYLYFLKYNETCPLDIKVVLRSSVNMQDIFLKNFLKYFKQNNILKIRWQFSLEKILPQTATVVIKLNIYCHYQNYQKNPKISQVFKIKAKMMLPHLLKVKIPTCH